MGISIRAYARQRGVSDAAVRKAIKTGRITTEPDGTIDPAKADAAVKGVPRGAALIGTPTAVDVTVQGRKLRRGVKVFSVAVGIAKLEFYNHLRKTAEVGEDGVTLRYPPGYVHLPKVDAEFLQQLCAEQLVTRRNRHGFPVREWQKIRERNEGLDIFVYCRAAASAAGLDRFEERHWRELERLLGIEEKRPDPPLNIQPIDPTEATPRGGLAISGATRTGRRVIKSRWLS